MKSAAKNHKDWEPVCKIIDSINSPGEFYKAMKKLNSGRYDLDIVNAAREYKECYNSAQY
ncbi:hypothetical protein LJC61_02830 [Ruminococcaceae bacterium OttesenSCG-928-A16]|nr:hypothetical protein [Ruminococcaceae bacterium OttesenSCG-928-A16]